jgi:hypothetical protein
MERHSPIILMANETKALHLKQTEDIIKKQMLYDIGLSDLVYEIDEMTAEASIKQQELMINMYSAALERIEESCKFIFRQFDLAC